MQCYLNRSPFGHIRTRLLRYSVLSVVSSLGFSMDESQISKDNYTPSTFMFIEIAVLVRIPQLLTRRNESHLSLETVRRQIYHYQAGNLFFSPQIQSFVLSNLSAQLKKTVYHRNCSS